MFEKNKVKQYMLENQGVTLSSGNIVEYSKGYQVAISKHDEKTFSDIDDALNYMATAYRMRYIGAWYDDGLWVVDINGQYIDNVNHAIQLGVDNDQTAIWDWATKSSIPLAEHRKIINQYRRGKK